MQEVLHTEVSEFSLMMMMFIGTETLVTQLIQLEPATGVLRENP